MIRRSPKRLYLCVALLILNLAFIWGNSMLPGELSGALSGWLKDILSHIIPIKPGDNQGHGLLRKMAHLTEFGCLGMCLSWFVRMLCPQRWKHWVLPLLGCFAAGCVDEIIQCFVPDRGPGLLDVGIDTFGALIGIILFSGVYFLKKKEKLSQEDW